MPPFQTSHRPCRSRTIVEIDGRDSPVKNRQCPAVNEVGSKSALANALNRGEGPFDGIYLLPSACCLVSRAVSVFALRLPVACALRQPHSLRRLSTVRIATPGRVLPERLADTRASAPCRFYRPPRSVTFRMTTRTYFRFEPTSRPVAVAAAADA